MRSIFKVRLWVEEQPEYYLNQKDHYADITLPATAYELLDALDKLQLEAGESPYWIITSYYASNCVIKAEQGSLYELNALAWRLSELDDRQTAAYEGLLKMAHKKENPLSNLIDLAYSTDCCRVVENVSNEFQLGLFCAQNGLVPGAENLPDNLSHLLNFEQIGREHLLREGGVIVKRITGRSGSYVEQNSDLMNVHQTLDLALREPEYALLLHIARGYYAPPASDCEEAVQLRLPASPEELGSVLTSLKVNNWRETNWYGLDCRVPLLTDMVYDIGVNEEFDEAWMERLNDLAQRLDCMAPETLTTYKALLSAADCKNMQNAILLMETLDEYKFSPDAASREEIAKRTLCDALGYWEWKKIEPCLDLDQYGDTLLRACGGVLTDYGLLERKDGQPVQDWNTGQDVGVQKQGGMWLV